MLGALLVQGIKTGPSHFREQTTIAYTLIVGLTIATLMMLSVGPVLGRYDHRRAEEPAGAGHRLSHLIGSYAALTLLHPTFSRLYYERKARRASNPSR